MLSLIIDVAAVAFIWIFALNGAKKGFIKALCGFMSYIVAFVASALFYKDVALYIGQLGFVRNITDKINSQIVSSLTTSVSEATGGMPEFMSDFINDGTLSASEAIGNGVNNIAINIFSIILIYVVVRLALNIFGNLSGKIKIPVIGSVNSIGGTALGIINAFIILYVIMGIIVLVAFSKNGEEVNIVMQSTYIAKMFYNNNMLVKLILK